MTTQVRLRKVGPAAYAYDSPDGTWDITQWAWPRGKGPAWYQFGYYWHLWSPDDVLRIKPVDSFSKLTNVREWLTAKYLTDS